MPILDLAGDYGADTRPARISSGRKPWAKDPTGPEASDGTRLDATFVNDLLGMLRGAATAYGVTQTPGDDDFLADIIAAATATPAAHDHDDRYYTEAEVDAAIAAAVAGLINSAPGALDTLNELAAALGDDADFAGTVTTALAAKQPLDATLTSLAALGTAADKLAYTTGIDTWAEAAITAAGRSMVGAANAAAQTALLDTFTSAAKGLAPASGGGTTNFLRADGSWAAPPSGSAFTGGDLSSALGIVAGSEAAPGLYVVGDTDTGLRSSGANILEIVTAGADRWRVNASGHLLAVDDATYDIGASGATRPRNIYSSSTIYTGNHLQLVGAVLWNGGSNIQNPSDGVLVLYNNGNTSFGRIQLGGTTSSFPALKRSSAELHGRLADDSAYANIVGAILEAKTSVKFGDATTQATAGVENIRLGTETSVSGSSIYAASAGNCITTITTDGGWPQSFTGCSQKPIQKYISGSWTTITG